MAPVIAPARQALLGLIEAPVQGLELVFGEQIVWVLDHQVDQFLVLDHIMHRVEALARVSQELLSQLRDSSVLDRFIRKEVARNFALLFRFKASKTVISLQPPLAVAHYTGCEVGNSH